MTQIFCILFLTGLDYIKSHLKETPVTTNEAAQSSEEDDFFSPIRRGNAQENTIQLDSYLACPDDTMEVLRSFPAVWNLSLQLNTPRLPLLPARGSSVLQDSFSHPEEHVCTHKILKPCCC